MNNDPLSGLKIILTRESEDNITLKEILRQRGAAVIELPATETRPVDPLNEKEVLTKWNDIGWTVFTSRKAVRFFMDWIKKIVAEVPPNSKFAAVGKGTSRSLFSAGVNADLVPEIENGEHLGKTLAEKSPPALSLFPQARGATKTAQAELRKASWGILELEIYETISRSLNDRELTELGKGADLAFIASPSALQSFSSNSRALSALLKIPVLPIGETTRRMAIELSLTTLSPPKDTGLPAILEAMEHFSSARMP
jgi:uroporphyrinogen III methyltransferase / synthase